MGHEMILICIAFAGLSLLFSSLFLIFGHIPALVRQVLVGEEELGSGKKRGGC